MQRRYWLKGLVISFIVPVLFFVFAIFNVEKGFEGFAYLFTLEVAVVSGIVGVIIGWLYGKIKNRSLPKL